MAKKQDQGGPNHLMAWRLSCEMTQQEVADKAVPPTTKQVYQALETNQMALSAKWLRRLAPAFGTRAGFILEFHPDDVDMELHREVMAVDKDKKQEAIGHLRVLKGRT